MQSTRLDRRRFLKLGAGALALPALSGGPLAHGSTGRLRALDFSMPLPEIAAGGARSAGRWHASEVLRAPARFDLVGLRWSHGGRPRVQLRTRRRGGGWSDWLALPLAGHHAPDRPAPLRGTEPAWTGAADELQLRCDRRLSGTRIHFVNATGTTTALGRARARLRAANAAARRLLAGTGGSAANGAPKIIPRSEWGGDSLPSKGRPDYGTVKLAFVHHTVGTNNYGPEDSAAIVLAIAKYHRNVNGWSDIGYNFLVDRYGQIFEGRAGGIDKAVVGAQAAGFNSVSTGVSNLGTFSTVEQAEPGIRACAAVIAWKLGLHGVPVSGTVVANGKTFERISGHRDANSTACPGDALYDQLTRIRQLAAEGAGPVGPSGALTMQSDRERLTAGQSALLSGTVKFADGSAPAGVLVELQARGTNGYRTTRKTRTDSQGRWSLGFKRMRNTRLRVRSRDASNGKRLYSSSLRVAVAPRLTAALDRRRIATGERVTVSGRVKPAGRALYADVERRNAKGDFVRVARVRAKARKGRYSARVRFAHSGLHRITMRSKGDSANTSASAQPLTVRVGGGRRSRTGGAALR